MKILHILSFLMSLGCSCHFAYAHKTETILELMGSTQDNPSLSRLRLPSGEPLLDRDKPRLIGNQQNHNKSSVIYVVRHGEKYFDDKIGKLNEQGWERAFALAAQMSLNSFFLGSYNDLEIIAADSPDGSSEPSRYIETAIPFARLQNKQIKAYYTHAEYQKLAEYLLTQENKRIFIFWEHKHMHNLIRALGFSEEEVPYYPTEDFGQIWKITDFKKLETFRQNLMYNDAFNFTKEEILNHSPQYPMRKQYPHGERYEIALSLRTRHKAEITCKADDVEIPCQNFNFRILDYDADAYRYVDAYIESNQPFDFSSGDVPCQDVQPLITWIGSAIDRNSKHLSEASDDPFLCSFGPIGPLATQIKLAGLGRTLCDDMRLQLLDHCAKSARLGGPSNHFGNYVTPIIYNSLATFAIAGGATLGFWVVKKCLKRCGKQGQYVEIPITAT